MAPLFAISLRLTWYLIQPAFLHPAPGTLPFMSSRVPFYLPNQCTYNLIGHALPVCRCSYRDRRYLYRGDPNPPSGYKSERFAKDP